MGTRKWHSLSHLVVDFLEVGGIECLHEPLFEGRQMKLYSGKNNFKAYGFYHESSNHSPIAHVDDRKCET